MKHLLIILSILFLPSLLYGQAEPEPVPPCVGDECPESFEKNYCVQGKYNEAKEDDTIVSYWIFLKKCTDKTSYWHKLASKRLGVLRTDAPPTPEPVPVLEPEPVPEPGPDPQHAQNRFCHYNYFNEASKKHTISSYKNFLSRCNDCKNKKSQSLKLCYLR